MESLGIPDSTCDNVRQPAQSGRPPFIESFFRRLAEGGFHRLSPTTGSSPKDTRRNNPDIAAKDTQFQLEYVGVARHHHRQLQRDAPQRSGLSQPGLTSWNGWSGKRPLLVWRPRCRSENGRRAQVVHLPGGVTSGRRPHFNLANARYSARRLSW